MILTVIFLKIDQDPERKTRCLGLGEVGDNDKTAFYVLGMISEIDSWCLIYYLNE